MSTDCSWDNRRGKYKPRRFDVPEATLLQLADMRATFVDNKDHPYSLPANFVAMSRKEETYYKVVERLIPRKAPPAFDRH